MHRSMSPKFFNALVLITLLAVFMGGCKEETPGIVNVCITPTVIRTSPANGGTNEPLNKTSGSTGLSKVAAVKIISATFSTPMDPNTISSTTFTLQQGATPISGTVTYTDTTALFVVPNGLGPNLPYTCTITTGARNLEGVALANNYVWNFSTGDITPPTVISTDPINNASGVALNKKIAATFSETMSLSTINTTTFTLRHGTTVVSGTVTFAGMTALFTSGSSLIANTTYTAIMSTGANDLSGNALAVNYIWNFTTGAAADVTPPTVISTDPANIATGVALNKKIAATFSEAMDPLTITTTTFTLTHGTTSVSGSVIYVGTTALFAPASSLAANTAYTATLSTGAKDLAGNALAVSYVWNFTTGAVADIIPPTVISTDPADLATNVALNKIITAIFSESMDQSTISTATITMTGLGGASVTGTVSYFSGTNTVSFILASNLAANTTYTGTIKGGATGTKDLAGNRLASNYVWSFTTGTGLAPGAVPLGLAGTYGIMATSAITNTGNSIINGDVSLDPGTSMTGFPPGVVNGTIHNNDLVSVHARNDLLAAYNFAKGLAPGTTISGGADLGASYPSGIPPGTYTSGSTMLVSTSLVLDAGGNANAVWVFQIGSSLTTTANVSLANGAQAKNVFWVPTLDATIGVGTIFYGTIVSGRDVSCVTGAVINGRILAGATTAGTIALQNNIINVPLP